MTVKPCNGLAVGAHKWNLLAFYHSFFTYYAWSAFRR